MTRSVLNLDRYIFIWFIVHFGEDLVSIGFTTPGKMASDKEFDSIEDILKELPECAYDKVNKVLYGKGVQ